MVCLDFFFFEVGLVEDDLRNSEKFKKMLKSAPKCSKMLKKCSKMLEKVLSIGNL